MIPQELAEVIFPRELARNEFAYAIIYYGASRSFFIRHYAALQALPLAADTDAVLEGIYRQIEQVKQSTTSGVVFAEESV
jgi:hypothetical protein